MLSVCIYVCMSVYLSINCLKKLSKVSTGQIKSTLGHGQKYFQQNIPRRST